ncbi:MAG: Rieske 2Fe-2S domain-containing protein [Betaproteobacteria bacterium]|nr:MAG: Rieske 2Fe-2S domain-containing protein [Betaproteobacteria bacterium]
MARGERLICAAGELVEGGSGVRFEIAQGGKSLAAFVVRWRGLPRAYVNECRHQSSELDWMQGDFFDETKLYLICATHGALYTPDSGICVAGPCRGARLAPLEVVEREGKVFCIEEFEE